MKLFLITFTGKIHKADGRWITNANNPASFESYYKNALGYWKGDTQSKFGAIEEEYLGSGTIQIVEEISMH